MIKQKNIKDFSTIELKIKLTNLKLHHKKLIDQYSVYFSDIISKEEKKKKGWIEPSGKDIVDTYDKIQQIQKELNNRKDKDLKKEKIR